MRLLPIHRALIASVASIAFSASCMGEALKWLDPNTTGSYVFVGPAVWDAKTGTLVSPTGAPDLSNGCRPVVGTDMVFNGRLINPDGSERIPRLEKSDSSVDLKRHFHIQRDHRRTFWVEDGDIWRGEIDWPNNKIVNAKRLTNVGVFPADYEPLLWWEQQLYIYGNFDPKKPVVHIDLTTGATQEIETLGVFFPTVNVGNGARVQGLISPDDARIVSMDPDLVHSYDARTGKPSIIGNGLRSRPSDRRSSIGFEHDARFAPVWDGDETVYGIQRDGFVFKIDLRNSRLEHLTQAAESQTANATYIDVSGIIPNSHFAVVKYSDSTRTARGVETVESMDNKVALIDLTSGVWIPTPIEPSAGAQWIDDKHAIFDVRSGGLANIGWWLYDRDSNSTSHIVGLRSLRGSCLVLPQQKELWAVDGGGDGGSRLKKWKLDGTGEVDLGICKGEPRILPPPIDLGFVTPWTSDPWKPVPVDTLALAATQPATIATGKAKFLLDIQNLSEEDKAYAINLFDYAAGNPCLGTFYDPEKVAMDLLAASKASGTKDFNDLLRNAKLANDVDAEGSKAWATERAKIVNQHVDYTADQQNQISTLAGTNFAAAFVKDPQADMNYINQLFDTSVIRARETVVPPARPVASNSPPPAQDQPPSPAPTPQVNKAKNAINSLRNIFGR
jgi:hypothetical protein